VRAGRGPSCGNDQALDGVALMATAWPAFAGKGSKTMGLERLIERMGENEFDLIAVGSGLIPLCNLG